MADGRLLIITPVRNEAAHIERVGAALAAQTRPPDRWLVVDDGSSDETPALLRRMAAELPFMDAVSTPPGYTRESADRLAVAAAPRAFNYGLATVDASLYSHIGKLDGDIELRPGYFEAILAECERNPRLGIAGGVILERSGDAWRVTPGDRRHVRGALKLYTSECLEAIGGIREQLGWDGIDTVLARMNGFETASFEHAEALHHRQTGSADGRLRGQRRWGEAHWTLYHGPLWTAVRAGRVATQPPRGISALAYLYGYSRAAVRRAPRLDVDGYREFVRAERRARVLRKLRPQARPGQLPLARQG